MSSFAPGAGGSEPPPISVDDVQPPNFRAIGQDIGDGVASSNYTKKRLDGLEGIIVSWVAAVLAYVLGKFINIIGYFGEILVKSREELDPSIAKLASEGIADLFGQGLPAAQWEALHDKGTRKQIAQLVGDQILRGLAVDLANAPAGTIEPSDAPAKAYLTRMAELSIEGWFESVVTGIVSEHPFEKLGELKEQVSSTFGFSRLTRRVLSPAVDVLVADPFKWQIQKQYRPKLLSEGSAVEMFLRGNLSREELDEELGRQGYSDRRINALIAESQRALSTGEVLTMFYSGYWTYGQATSYLGQRGYSEDVATLLIQQEKQRLMQDARQKALDDATRSYIDRFIELPEYSKFVDAAIVDADIRHEILTQAAARRELNKSRVSEAKAEEAVVLGFWNIDQYTDHLRRKGFNDDDVLTMQLLVQEKIREASDKTAKQEKAAKAAAAAKAAKQAAAEQRLAQLDAARSHKDLSLSTVHRAYVQGKMTLAQYHDFLTQQNQAAADIETLLDLAQAERADYQAAQAKKARVDQKLAVTSLSTSQLEHSVEIGAMTIEDFQSILVKEGITEGDVALLVKSVQTNVQAKADAKARHDAVAAQLATKGLSLAQEEQAVRQGLRSLGDFKKYLAFQKYGAADQVTLAGLLQDRIDADKAAEAKKEAAAAKLQSKSISLPALELAVRKGLRPITDYQKALADSGVVPADVQTLVALIQSKLDDDKAIAARKAEILAKQHDRGLALTTVERAARLGVVSVDVYRQDLVKAGLQQGEQDVMLELLQAEQARIAQAKTKQQQAAEKLKNKPVPLAEFKKGVLLGVRTVAQYRIALQDAGFDADAVDLLVSLMQDQAEQYKAGQARKAQLDAQRGVREISRQEFERAVQAGLKTLADYKAFLVEQKYDEEDQGILFDLLTAKVGP